jgi:uncharacterized protein (TIRG00374 family)
MLITATKISISVGVLVWLVATERLKLAQLLSAPFTLVHFLGLSAVLVNMLLQAVRWWWLLNVQNLRLSVAQVIQLSWIGQFFSTVLPGAAGGDLVRVYYVIGKTSQAKLAGISTVVMDRVLGFYSLLCLGMVPLIAIAMLRDKWSLPITYMMLWTSFAFVVATVLLGFIWLQRSRHFIGRLLPTRFAASLATTLDAYRPFRKDLGVCFGFSVLANTSLMVAFVAASQTLTTPLAWWEVALVCPVVIIANSLPLSPGGFGVAESAASLLFANFGVETGAAIMVFVRFWFLLLRLPGGLIYVLQTRGALNSRLLGDIERVPKLVK